MLVTRATYVTQPLRSDEGGYLLVARQWHHGGEFLYGDYFVDRPPLLMAVFRLAALSGWDPMIRLLTLPVALLFVVAAARAGLLMAGRTASWWSALVAAGFMCSPALAADQADGELFAATAVMVAIALTLEAWHASAPRSRLAWAVAAGLVAGSAPLLKQSFLDALVFAAVLLAVGLLRGRARSGLGSILVGGVLGLAVPFLAVSVWAVTVGIRPQGMWQELADFRSGALEVIWSGHTDAPLTRAVALVLLGTVSGLLLVVASWLLAAVRSGGRGTPEEWAVTITLLFGLVAMAGGGSFWPHYLLQLAPAAALAAGAAAAVARGRWMRRWSRLVVGVATLGSVVLLVVYATVPWVWFQQRTGEWLAASARPGDTAVVTYGHPVILQVAGLESPYPHLWSLPMRTLDPEQLRLEATLAGPDAPQWIVQVNDLDSWQIDTGDRLRTLLEQRYTVAAVVCGSPVWLRTDQTRALAPPPRC